jgi:hypothetical protein
MGRSEGQVTVAGFCPHSKQTGALCPQCVTLIGVALGVLDRSTIEVVAALADDYAMRVLDDLPQVESEEALRDGLAGAFLSFLADAVLTAHNMRE